MDRYVVVKNYGYFQQMFLIDAKSDDDAWNRATKDGDLIYQIMRTEKTESLGHVYIDNSLLSSEQYCEILKEAVNEGMLIKTYEYNKIFGLPFHDVW